MADAKDAKAGGGGAPPARRATDAQKAARARREKSIEVPWRDGDSEYLTIKANDPNVEVRWAPNALAAFGRWPGWKKSKTERSAKPAHLPAVPRDEFGFPSYLADHAGLFGCHALVLEVVSDGGGAAIAAAADPKVVVEATFCASPGASGCGSTPAMCKQHCESALLWFRIHGIQRPACKQHKVDQAWDYVDAEDERVGVNLPAAPGGAPVLAAAGDLASVVQQLQHQLQQQIQLQQQPLQLQVQQLQQQQLLFQQQVLALLGTPSAAAQPTDAKTGTAPPVPAAYIGGPDYRGTAANPLLDADGASARSRMWIDPLSGMAVDTQTAKLSVSRDAAVVAVYNEWLRRKESKTIFEFLRAYATHKEYTWHERPAVNGLPAVAVAEQKKEWKELIDDLESVAKDHPDVTKVDIGLRILRKLVIIHCSHDVDIVSALSESARVVPRELTTFTRFQKGLPIRGVHGATVAVNANTGDAAGAGGDEGVVPGGAAAVVHLKQQPIKR